MKKFNILLGVVLALALTTSIAYGIGGAGWNIAEGSGWQFLGQVRFEDDVTAFQDVTINGDLTTGDDLTVPDLLTVADLAVTEELTVTSNGTFDANVIVDNKLATDVQSTVVVTIGTNVPVLGTYVPVSTTVSNTGNSTISNGTITGQLLILHNVGSATLVFTDTGTLHLTGNATLTADDSTILIWSGAFWNQLAAESAN